MQTGSDRASTDESELVKAMILNDRCRYCSDRGNGPGPHKIVERPTAPPLPAADEAA